MLVKSAVDRGEYRWSLLPRGALPSLIVASFTRTRLRFPRGRVLVSCPAAQLPWKAWRSQEAAVTVNTAGGGGGGASWMVWGCLHASISTLSRCLPPPPFPPSGSCRKAALAGGSGEAGLLAFPTCLKSGTWKWPERLSAMWPEPGPTPWSPRPEAALGRGSGLPERLHQLRKHQISEGVTWVPSFAWTSLSQPK